MTAVGADCLAHGGPGLLNRFKQLDCLSIRERVIHWKNTLGSRVICKAGSQSRPQISPTNRFQAAASPAPSWHAGALEPVPLSGIVRRRGFIHAAQDSDRR